MFAALLTSAQPAFPDTPAGRTPKAWFEAFNSGDRTRMESYLQKFDPARPIDNQMNFRNQTGGFDLLSTDKSERTHIEFRVKEKAGATTAIGRFEVKDADPAEVVSFRLRALPPGVTEADFNVDAAARQRAIDGAAAFAERLPANRVPSSGACAVFQWQRRRPSRWHTRAGISERMRLIW